MFATIPKGEVCRYMRKNMKGNTRVSLPVWALAAVIGALSIFSLLSLLIAAFAGGTPGRGLGLSGFFLLKSFSWAGFYVPIYLSTAVFLLIRNKFYRKNVAVLCLSIVPFLTASLILHLIIEPSESLAINIVLRAFGRTGGTLLLSLIFVLQIITLLRIGRSIAVSSNQVLQLSDARIPPQNDAKSPEISEYVPILSGQLDLTLDPPASPTQYEEPDRPLEVPSAEPVTVNPVVEDAQYEYIDEDNSVLAVEKQYQLPMASLLDDYPDDQYREIDDETRYAAEILKGTLEEFNIRAEVTGIRKGPVITMFEILPAPGVKLSKIVNLADNIALRLAASRVRIVAPIPGKHAVGIEVPNHHRAIVSFREVVDDKSFHGDGMEIPIALGKDITGEAQIIDLTQTPHLLIAGATGSGKSVCVNSIISSILYTREPSEVKLLLIDPKIVELKLYNDIPHLLTRVVTEPKRAFQALQYCIYEMERRYALLDSLGVRDIKSYNKKVRSKRIAVLPLPYIVIIVDEFADLMSSLGKELESALARLAAMSRAVGLHLVLATQRPSVDVITGLIKANIPSRIAFMVASKFDSRIIIDAIGADKLLGRGDMLFTSAWDPFPIRIQGAFLSEGEVEQVTDYVKTLGEPDYLDDEIFFEDDDEGGFYAGGDDDPLTAQALDIVVNAGKASASYLQRKLKIGYNRAARLVEQMEERGIVGPPQGSKPREILHIPANSGNKA